MSQLNLPKCRLSTGQCSLAFRGANEYKLLPENTRNIKNISTTSYKDHDQPLDSWTFSECTSNVGEMLGTFDNSDYISEA